MKTRLLIAVVLLVATMVACKKQSNSTANNKGSSPPPVPASTMNDSACATGALVGIWVFDSSVYYNGGVVYAVQTPTVGLSDATYTLSLTPFGGGSLSKYHQVSYKGESNAQAASGMWWVDAEYMQSTGLLSLTGGVLGGYIRQLDAHSLLLSENPGNVKQGHYNYYHK